MLLSLKLTIFLTTIFLYVRGNWGLRQINYTQVVDHSYKTNNNSYITFNQRVYVDDLYWGGAPSPIFAYFGGETNLDLDQRIDLLTRSAQQFQGLVIYIEHRFYGRSVPLGSIKSAMANHNVGECLTVEQTLLDFKEIIHSLKNNISAHDSPVIVVGTGYAGVLAVYFRLLYPNATLGALASSAPIMLFSNTTQMNGYCSKISQDFETKRRPFQSVDDIKLSLAGLYAFATEYDTPKHELMFSLCIYMKGDVGLIGGVAAGLVETLGNGVCFGRYIAQSYSTFQPSTNFTLAWDWQRCNELVFPMGCESNPMRLPLQPFNLTEFTESCRSQFGVVPKPKSIASYFGNKDIIKTLKEHGSNIIFSNGLWDPLINAGIIEDLSDTILAINTAQGAQHLDLRVMYDEDPDWLESKASRNHDIRQLDQPISPIQ